MSEKEVNLENFKMMMGGEAELTAAERKIIVMHSLNRWNGLVCLDDEGKECEYPVNWRQNVDSSCIFTYRNNKNGKKV